MFVTFSRIRSWCNFNFAFWLSKTWLLSFERRACGELSFEAGTDVFGTSFSDPSKLPFPDFFRNFGIPGFPCVFGSTFVSWNMQVYLSKSFVHNIYKGIVIWKIHNCVYIYTLPCLSRKKQVLQIHLFLEEAFFRKMFIEFHGIWYFVFSRVSVINICTLR